MNLAFTAGLIVSVAFGVVIGVAFSAAQILGLRTQRLVLEALTHAPVYAQGGYQWDAERYQLEATIERWKHDAYVASKLESAGVVTYLLTVMLLVVWGALPLLVPIETNWIAFGVSAAAGILTTELIFRLGSH